MPKKSRLLFIGFVYMAIQAGSASAQCNSVPIAVNDQVDHFGRPINYRIEDERGFTANAQMFVQLNSLFVDGFETGNTSRWALVTSGGGVEP